MKVSVGEEEVGVVAGKGHRVGSLVVGACGGSGGGGGGVVRWGVAGKLFAVGGGAAGELHRGSLRSDGECTVDIWEIVREKDGEPGARVVGSVRLEGASVYDIAFSGDGKTLAVATASGDVWLVEWTEAEGKWEVSGKIEGGEKSLVQWRVCWHPTKRQLAVGSFDGSLSLVDVDSMKRWVMSAHGSAVRCIRFRADGKMFATAGHDGRIRLWDPLNPLTPLVDEKLGLVWLMSVEWISDTEIVVATDDGFIRIVYFNLEIAKAFTSNVVCHTGSAWEVAVLLRDSPENCEVFSCGSDGNIVTFRIGDSANLQKKRHRRTPKAPRRIIVLTPRGINSQDVPSTKDGVSEPSFSVWYSTEGQSHEVRNVHAKSNRALLKLPLVECEAITSLSLSAPSPSGNSKDRLLLAAGTQGLFILAKVKEDALSDDKAEAARPKKKLGRPRKRPRPAEEVEEEENAPHPDDQHPTSRKTAALADVPLSDVPPLDAAPADADESRSADPLSPKVGVFSARYGLRTRKGGS